MKNHTGPTPPTLERGSPKNRADPASRSRVRPGVVAASMVLLSALALAAPEGTGVPFERAAAAVCVGWAGNETAPGDDHCLSQGKDVLPGGSFVYCTFPAGTPAVIVGPIRQPAGDIDSACVSAY